MNALARTLLQTKGTPWWQWVFCNPMRGLYGFSYRSWIRFGLYRGHGDVGLSPALVICRMSPPIFLPCFLVISLAVLSKWSKKWQKNTLLKTTTKKKSYCFLHVCQAAHVDHNLWILNVQIAPKSAVHMSGAPVRHVPNRRSVWWTVEEASEEHRHTDRRACIYIW